MSVGLCDSSSLWHKGNGGGVLGLSSTFGAWGAGELVGDSYMGTLEEEQQFGVGSREEISFSFF